MIRHARLRFLFAVTVGCIICNAPQARAQTWTGLVTGNWSNTLNWAPAALPASNINTQLQFGATGNSTLSNDLLGQFTLNSFTINSGAPAYSLTGNTVNFRTNALSATPTLTMNSANALTISNPIVITDPLTVGGSGSGAITFNGAISGGGSLTYTGNGSLTLGSGSNTYSGGTFVSFATLVLGANSAIPAGTNVNVGTFGTFNIGNTSNNSLTAIGTLTLNEGTFRAPSGNGDYHLNKLVMTDSTINLTGTTNLWLHFRNAGASITTTGDNSWYGSGTSRIQNDTASPLTVTVTGNLYAGVILSSAGTNPNFNFTGSGSTQLGNSGNTANITATNTGIGTSDLSTNVGSGAYGTLGTGTFTLANSRLTYDGPTATSAKPIILSGEAQIFVFGSNVNLTMNGLITQSAVNSSLTTLGPSGGGASSTLTLTAANLYNGYTRVDYNSILAVPTIADGGISSPIGSSTSVPANLLLGSSGGRGTLLYTGAGITGSTNRGATVGGLYSAGSGGAIGVQDSGAFLSVTGQITGPGSFIKTGPGTLSIGNGSNDFTGGAYIEGGTLSLGNPSAMPAGSNVVVSSGATFSTGGQPNGFAGAIGTVVLNGSTFTLGGAGGQNYFLNKLLTDATGGTVNTSGTSFKGPNFVGSAPQIVINGNSTWIGPADSFIGNLSGQELLFSVAPNATLTSPLNLLSSSAGATIRVTGGGSLYLTNPALYQAFVTVNQARLRLDSLVNFNAVNFNLTLDRGTLAYGGPTASYSALFALATDGGTIEVTNPATTLTLTGAIANTFSASLTKTGPGTLILNNLSNSYLGGLTVAAGRLDVGNDNQLGLANPTVNPAGTIRFTASSNSSRTFNLNGGTLEASGGATSTLNGAAVNGGFLRGPGIFALTGGTALNGATTFNNATLNQTGPTTLANFTHGGNLTNSAGQTLTWNGGSIAASGTSAVNGIANVSNFSSLGRLSVNPGGVLNNSGSNLVFGGGSITNLGLYNPSTGQVTQGGTISLGDTDMIIQGGLVRNNGTITSNNGNIIVDYGGTLRGSGPVDVNQVILRNGGQRFSGNSPGLSPNRNVDLTNAGAYVVDNSNAVGIAGSGDPTGYSGWGVYEYGAISLSTGRLTITGTPASKAIFKMTTVTDVAPRNTPAPLTNFDSTQPHTWVVIRPGTEAGFNVSSGANDPAYFANFTTQNTSAPVSITDALTNVTFSGAQLNDLLLNQYLTFDASGWNWGSTPLAQQGTFAFAFQSDTLGNPNRMIAVVYSPAPVPEPTSIMLMSAIAAGGLVTWQRWRRRWEAAPNN